MPRRVLGLIFLVGMAGVTVIGFTGVFRAPFAPDTYTVVADFERAPQVIVGDQVRLEGNIEGKVTEIEPAPQREGARVTMKVEKAAGKVYADASARLRVKTLLGGSFYVDLNRGTPGTGALGDHVIGLDRTTVQTEIEDVTDIFRADAVTGAQTLPHEIGKAMQDPVAPVSAVRKLDRVARDAAIGVSALRGTQPGKDIPRLMDATAKAVTALDTPTDDIRRVVSGAAATLAATGRRSAELRQAIAAGPGVSRQLRSTLGRLDGTLATARGTIKLLDRGIPALAPTLSDLRPTLPLLDRTLRNATPLIKEVGDTAEAGGQLGTTVGPLLEGAHEPIRRADKRILPYFGRKDPVTGYTTTVMTGGFLSAFGGIASAKDEFGHFIRFAVGGDKETAFTPCSSSLIDPTASASLACDSFDSAVKQYLNFLPDGLVPTPGKVK